MNHSNHTVLEPPAVPPPEAKTPLSVLMVEDNPFDAEIVARELGRAGYAPKWQRVDNEPDFLKALDSQPDIILSDYSMPQFSGLRAAQILRERDLEIPFILVSAAIGDETAVAIMRAGAADYLLKDRLGRLGEAVRHALEERELRIENRRTTAELHRTRDDLAQRLRELEALNVQLTREVNERIDTQRTLEKLRRDQDLILNSAGEGICGVDSSGSIIFANPKSLELLGWELSELLGKSVFETFHPPDALANAQAIEASAIFQTMEDGETRRIRTESFARKDGSLFATRYVVAPMRNEGGEISGGIIVFNDITAELAAATHVKQQAEQYRLLFDTNPNPMWVFDTETLNILAVNDAALAQYGYTAAEFMKLNIKDLRPPEDVPDLIKPRPLSSPPGAPQFSGQFRHVRKDGSLIHVEIYSGPVTWKGVSGRIVTAIDVTERKRVEERLREQADIINQAHEAIIIRTYDTEEITFWNTGAERLYGWTSDEVLGKPVGELLFVDADVRKEKLAQLVAKGEFRGELTHRTKSGREVIVDARATIIRDADGAPRSVLSINADVTEQKNLEVQLRRTQRLESIGTLASGVAHDLNNVLSPILMCAEMLGNDATETTAPMISLIEQSARRGAGIVKQVLTFARGVEGQRVSLKASHLIQEMVDIANQTFPKSIHLSGRYPSDLWCIEGDPTQLHQVLLNLCVNARDAMPRGGTITISADNFEVDEQYASMTPNAKVGPYLRLRVTDTGTGIPHDALDKIFDPFYTTKEVGKGTGLGLSTVLGIVETHGGFLSVESHIGRGTTFEIMLPAHITEAEEKPGALSPGALDGKGEVVLLVDDEPGILAMTRRILEKHNYRVICANDGPEALAVTADMKEPIDLMLTDIAMPYMDGVALIRSVRKMRPSTRFIASTGQEDTRAAELAALSVSQLLTKPYDRQRLLKTVRSALDEAPPVAATGINGTPGVNAGKP